MDKKKLDDFLYAMIPLTKGQLIQTAKNEKMKSESILRDHNRQTIAHQESKQDYDKNLCSLMDENVSLTGERDDAIMQASLLQQQLEAEKKQSDELRNELQHAKSEIEKLRQLVPPFPDIVRRALQQNPAFAKELNGLYQAIVEKLFLPTVTFPLDDEKKQQEGKEAKDAAAAQHDGQQQPKEPQQQRFDLETMQSRLYQVCTHLAQVFTRLHRRTNKREVFL
jgi:translation initiation factor 2B subunit (eIF-2B alpha/beta/delta family)